jgi:hypothetical protein
VKNNPTTRQHVVSQALLNRFASPDGLISAYDVRWGITKQKTSKAIGFQENFVMHEPNATEAIWKEVEDRIGPRSPRLTFSRHSYPRRPKVR